MEEAPVREGHRGNDVGPMCESNTVVDASHEKIEEPLHMHVGHVLHIDMKQRSLVGGDGWRSLM